MTDLCIGDIHPRTNINLSLLMTAAEVLRGRRMPVTLNKLAAQSGLSMANIRMWLSRHSEMKKHIGIIRTSEIAMQLRIKEYTAAVERLKNKEHCIIVVTIAFESGYDAEMIYRDMRRVPSLRSNLSL
jgi:hypothetical protein